MVLLYHRPYRMTAKSGTPAPAAPSGRHGWKPPLPVAEGVAGKPSCNTSGRTPYFRYSSQGCGEMTLYGYARVSVREPEDKNLDLQVERLVLRRYLHRLGHQSSTNATTGSSVSIGATLTSGETLASPAMVGSLGGLTRWTRPPPPRSA